MAVELDTLEIRIEASASNAAAALDKLAASLKNVKNAMKGVGGEKKFSDDMKKSAEAAEQAAKKEESAVSNAEKATEKLNQTQNKAAGSGKKFSMSLADITKATGKVQSGISGIFNGLKTGNASSLLGGFSSLKSVFSEMKIGGGDGGSGTTAAAEGATRAGEAFAKMSGEAGKAGAAAGEAGEIAGASAGGWQAVAIAVGVKVVAALAKAYIGFQKFKAKLIISPFLSIARHASEAAGKINQVFRSLGRVAGYRLIRTVLKEISEGFSLGLENAYYFSQVTGGLLAKSLDSISTEMLYLKNSVGAAVAPLINALAPAVEFVVDKFVGLVNVVNQFLSALGVTGKWIKAIKYPTKYGDALDDATGSAKELKRTILGIDEINPLDGDNGSGKGKSGLTASDYSSMFEYATVNPQISDFAAKIKEMVENGKWTEVGQTLAAKINGLITTADQKIKWENVGGKITKWLTNITNAFNGFVRDFDARGLGNLVGDAIMTAVNTIDTAVNLTDFEALGDKITDFINGGLEAIDGQQIGKTIHDTVKKVLGLVTQVLNGIDKGALSEDVSGFFTGLDLADLIASFKEAMGALGKLVWPALWEGIKGIGGALFTALKQDIKDAFDPNVDNPWWIDIITSLSPAAVTAKLIAKIADINWKEIFDSLKAGLEYRAKSLWNSLIDAIINISSKSSLTSWIGDLLGGAKFDLGDTAVGKAAEKAASIYDQFSKIFNGAGLKASEGFETGLNTDKTVGKAFGDNVNKNVDGEGNGKRGGNAYRSGIFTTLSFGPNETEKKQGNGLFSKIATALGIKDYGGSGGSTYRFGFFDRIKAGLSTTNTKDGKSFLGKIAGALGIQDYGGSGGSTYRFGFFDRIKAGLSETNKKDGKSFLGKIAGALGIQTTGGSDGSTYRFGFFDRIKAGLSATNTKDGKSFLGKIAGALGIQTTGGSDGSTYRFGFFDRIKAGLSETNKKDGKSFLGKIAGALGIQDFGGSDSSVYANGFFGGLDGYEGNGGGTFGTTVSANVYKGADPDGKGSLYGTNFSTALDSIATLFAGGKTFGEKIASNITSAAGNSDNFKSGGNTIFSLINSIFTQKNAETYKTGSGFGVGIGHVISGVLGLWDTYTYGGQNLSNRIDSAIGTSSFVGKAYGKSVGQNIAKGIETGFNSTTIHLSVSGVDHGGNGGKFASGGIVDAGQMFIAREAGPELVGNIGRKTAVANTTQMVDAMAQGVYQANAESNMLLRQIIEYAAEIAAKEYESGGSVTVESITQAMTRNNRRLGKTVVAVG